MVEWRSCAYINALLGFGTLNPVALALTHTLVNPKILSTLLT